MRPDDSLPAETAGELASFFLPGTGGPVTRLLKAVRDEWSRNGSRALKMAERTSGLTREDLAERIENQPELVPLVTRLLWEVAMTGQGPLLEAMGAAFGAAVAEPSRTVEYELILGGLRNLHGDDVRILREMRDRQVFHQQAEEEETQESAEFQTARRLGERLRTSEAAMAFGLVRLVNQGFASSMTVLSGTRYEITGLGRLLYDALERMNDA